MSLIISNEDIINSYTKTIKKNNFHDIVTIRSIHKNQDICFNSEQREILYAIQKCFNEINNYNSFFKECLFGKALIISIEKIPKNPPFNNLKKNYKLKFLDRINNIENHLKLHKINYEDLNYKKNKLLLSYSSIIYCKILPYQILKKILLYLHYDFNLYKKLRNEYEERRKKIIINI